MIIYTESQDLTKEIFDSLPENDRKNLTSSGKHEKLDNYLFSFIFQNHKRKNIGFIDVLLDDKYKQPYIAIATLPEYRNKGIATKLLKVAENECKLKKFTTLYYTINNPDNIQSIQFSLKHNFYPDYQVSNFIVMKKLLL